MPTIDTLRPTVDTSTVVAYTVVGGTEAWEVLDDTPADDNTYIDPPGTPPPPVPKASLGFGSTSLPSADYRRHQLRFNLRGFSTAGPGQQAETTLFFGFHQWTQRLTFNGATPTELFGTWRTCPPELVDLSPALVAGTISAPASGVGASPMQANITEAYVDVDYRHRPTYTGVTYEGNTPEVLFQNTNIVRVGFENVDADDLPTVRWQIEIVDAGNSVVWSYDFPSIPSVPIPTLPLPNGLYTARFRLTTRVAGNIPFEGEWDEVAFEIDVAPPDPPDVTVADNEDGTVDVCWVPPGVRSLQVFTESGTWDWEAAGSPATVNVLMIGGGGAGGLGAGTARGSGGGAGRVRVLTNYPVTGDVSVVVGAGGVWLSSPNGGDSSFDGQISEGGGGGVSTGDGHDGGSGGGGGAGNPSGVGGTGISPGGNDGGDGFAGTGATRASGGGGGAGGVGGDASSAAGGDGGPGVDLSHLVGTLYGDNGWFAGGGGGATDSGGYQGVGGIGGGGDAGFIAGHGLVNSGSGGGGCTAGGGSQPGQGGSGIVIVYQGTPVGDGTVMAEIFRTDCQGTRRVHVQDATIPCWTDCTAPHSIDDVCGTDGQPCAITYEVRFWACVGGFVLVSDPTITDPVTIENPMPGFDWLTTTIDGECVKVALCGTGGWNRGRPFSVHTPVEGGLPTVITAVPGGRDYTLNLATATITDLHVLEDLLAQPLVWYQPAFDHGTWLAPNSESWQPQVVRSRSGTVGFVATGPTPVIPPEILCTPEPPPEEL